jgi:lipid-A-disaccharide synthase
VSEVLFIAGEASGDLHAAGVAEQLGRIRPELKLVGIGGPRMKAAGVELIAGYGEMAVMGFIEVIRHLPRHLEMLDEVRTRLERGRVSLLVLVDYPGFNMKAARAAAAAGVPVLYYVTPQVWAWGAGRLPGLAKTVTRAAVILPFEEQLLRGYGVNATFVGHPLLDRAGELPSREAARASLKLSADRPVLALFPGSREQEIDRHLDVFVETARIVEGLIPGIQIIVSVAPTVTLAPARCSYQRVESASFTVLRAADAALCKSGTTTLEAAIADCPLVVAYRTGFISYLLARVMVKIPHIGLVNVVAGREVAREFVQDALRASDVAAALVPLLEEGSEERQRVLDGLAEVRSRLGTPGAASRVAAMASELVP